MSWAPIVDIKRQPPKGALAHVKIDKGEPTKFWHVYTENPFRKVLNNCDSSLNWDHRGKRKHHLCVWYEFRLGEKPNLSSCLILVVEEQNTMCFRKQSAGLRSWESRAVMLVASKKRQTSWPKIKSMAWQRCSIESKHLSIKSRSALACCCRNLISRNAPFSRKQDATILFRKSRWALKFGSDPVNPLISEIIPNRPPHPKFFDVQQQDFRGADLRRQKTRERHKATPVQSDFKNHETLFKKKHLSKANQSQNMENLYSAAEIHSPQTPNLEHPQTMIPSNPKPKPKPAPVDGIKPSSNMKDFINFFYREAT